MEDYTPYCDECHSEFPDKSIEDMQIGPSYANGDTWICPDCGAEVRK